MNEAAETASRLSETGIVAILLFLLLLMVGVCLYVARLLYIRLFNKEDGIVTSIAAKHLELLDTASTFMNDQGESNKKLDSHMKRQIALLTHSAESHRAYCRVWKKHIGILRAMAKKLELTDEVEPHLEEMEQMLQLEEPPSDVS